MSKKSKRNCAKVVKYVGKERKSKEIVKEKLKKQVKKIV